MEEKKRSEMYERADEAIQKAFFSLLEKKDFDKITASDIIRVSGVNRSTFYRHYVDKYEILDRIKASTATIGDDMIAPFIVGNRHQFDILFNSDYMNNAVPEHFKRILLLLLKVRTESFDMEKIVKNNFARQFPSGGDSPAERIKREIYADICYRLLIYSLTAKKEEDFDVYKILRDITDYISPAQLS